MFGYEDDDYDEDRDDDSIHELPALSFHEGAVAVAVAVAAAVTAAVAAVVVAAPPAAACCCQRANDRGVQHGNLSITRWQG